MSQRINVRLDDGRRTSFSCPDVLYAIFSCKYDNPIDRIQNVYINELGAETSLDVQQLIIRDISDPVLVDEFYKRFNWSVEITGF